MDTAKADVPQSRPERTDPMRLLTGPIVGPMMALAGPMIAVLVAQTIVGVAETFYIGRLGTDALAGAALVFPLSMLMTMMSNGGIGGGVASAIARATGAGRHDEADALAFHAIVLAVVFGAAFTIAAVVAGPPLYRALGGHGGVLATAVTYSTYVFAASIPTWLANLMAAALRGVGHVRVPALVTLVGSAILVPLSPLLIFGFGPVPRLGVAGAGIAIMVYYLGATAYLWTYLRSGRGGLTLRFGRLQWRLFASILRVGLVSAIGALIANLTVIVVTGLVGRFGADAIAGYGAASRLDYVQIPFLFGLGTAVVTMVGVNVGVGQHARAGRIAWIGAAIAAAATEIVGLLAALFPHLWIGIFSRDPAVLAAGATYLHRVAPAYGAVGLGMLLYFAAQGRGRMLVPFLASLARLGIAAGAGWFAVARYGANPSTLFLVVMFAALSFGVINALGALLSWRSGSRNARDAARSRDVVDPDAKSIGSSVVRAPTFSGNARIAGVALAVAIVAAATAICATMLKGRGDVATAAVRAHVVRSVRISPAQSGIAHFTGVVHARYESNLGFRVSGKILERFVDPGQRVRVGQPLMRLDETDFELARKAAHSAVEAARATSVQATSDERRRRSLVAQGWVSRQAYEQNKSAADASVARLDSALSQERQVDDQLSYAILRADADGVIMNTPGEPGQVVAAGQAVVQLAHDGPREAEVYLPEGEEGAATSPATARLYAKSESVFAAKLRELAAMADPATRTYRARYVLEGAAKDAPLGATVTVGLSEPDKRVFSVPVGAIFDNGAGPSIWVIGAKDRRLSRRPVSISSMGEEQAQVKGDLKSGEDVVALGANLLGGGETVAADAAPLDTAAR